ncbi:MAG: glycosyltransferase [Mucilaginibacter sp.]|nr:glycosyltransferase [Mucilaginibacter sp.]
MLGDIYVRTKPEQKNQKPDNAAIHTVPAQIKLTPFFSIIIPLYNSALSLKDSLNSILTQSFKNYEIIFIDGGSSDNTLQIISDFENLNNTLLIKLLSGYDNGIYDAMNKGIGLASGKWLYFMGGDDTLYRADVLNEVYKELQKENVDLIYGNVYGVFSKTKYVYDTLSKVLSTGLHHQSAFYKTILFTDLGKYDLNFKIAADYHFTLKVFLNDSYKKKYINKDIAYYGEGGYSSQNFDYKFFSGHYRNLAIHNGIDKIEDPEKCLNDSIYCCLYLAKEKKELGHAWSNLFYYLTHVNGIDAFFKVKTFFRMLMWTLKSR